MQTGRDRTLMLSLGLLLLASGLALAKSLGEGLAHLQTGSQIRTFYAAVVAYEYGALPATGLIFLGWVFLVAVGFRRFRQPAVRRTALVAVGLTSLALLWAGLSTLPQLLVGYSHLSSVSTDADDYHLGVRTALDGDFFFILSQCPHGQLRCTAYGVAGVKPDEHDALSDSRLTMGDTDETLTIQTATRRIPVRLPLSAGLVPRR
jgi:hypothetical protein